MRFGTSPMFILEFGVWHQCEKWWSCRKVWRCSWCCWCCWCCCKLKAENQGRKEEVRFRTMALPGKHQYEDMIQGIPPSYTEQCNHKMFKNIKRKSVSVNNKLPGPSLIFGELSVHYIALQIVFHKSIPDLVCISPSCDLLTEHRSNLNSECILFL